MFYFAMLFDTFNNCYLYFNSSNIYFVEQQFILIIHILICCSDPLLLDTVVYINHSQSFFYEY